MARIDIKSTGGGSVATGVLQLLNGVALDATLRSVTDQNNTVSPLKLSTTLVQTTSTLKITTADNPYIDAEDNSGNNRFTIGRDPASQVVNVDFASNPTGSTSLVGSIRTYVDGVNLLDVMQFRENGQVAFGSLNCTGYIGINRASDGTENGYISTGGSGLIIRGGASFINCNNSFSNSIGTGILTLNAMWGIKGSGSTSATTSLLVQNSAGTEMLRIYDNAAIVGTGARFSDVTIGGYPFHGTNSREISVNGGSLALQATQGTGVIIGGITLDSSAFLQVNSTTKGFAPPRMTTAQKNAIATPLAGLVVYDTDLNKLCVRGAANWETITSI
jgi:hypothetical protein